MNRMANNADEEVFEIRNLQDALQLIEELSVDELLQLEPADIEDIMNKRHGSMRAVLLPALINKYGLKTNLLLSGNKEKSAMAIINKYGSYKNLYYTKNHKNLCLALSLYLIVLCI